MLDFVAYVRANNLMPVRGVTICYSSSSLPLLQFVTNNLLPEKSVGIEIRTALTRHDDLEVINVYGSAPIAVLLHFGGVSRVRQGAARAYRLDLASPVQVGCSTTEPLLRISILLYFSFPGLSCPDGVRRIAEYVHFCLGHF